MMFIATSTKNFKLITNRLLSSIVELQLQLYPLVVSYGVAWCADHDNEVIYISSTKLRAKSIVSMQIASRRSDAMLRYM
jgi:hypothetical protein